MQYFKFDNEKAMASILMILNKTKEIKLDKLIEILYLSDVEHLKEYGRPVNSNTYIKSNGFLIAKEIQSDILISLIYRSKIKSENHLLSALVDTDLMELSISDERCISRAIKLSESFNIKEKSSWKNTENSEEITIYAILDDINDENLKKLILG